LIVPDKKFAVDGGVGIRGRSPHLEKERNDRVVADELNYSSMVAERSNKRHMPWRFMRSLELHSEGQLPDGD